MRKLLLVASLALAALGLGACEREAEVEPGVDQEGVFEEQEGVMENDQGVFEEGVEIEEE